VILVVTCGLQLSNAVLVLNWQTRVLLCAFTELTNLLHYLLNMWSIALLSTVSRKMYPITFSALFLLHLPLDENASGIC